MLSRASFAHSATLSSSATKTNLCQAGKQHNWFNLPQSAVEKPLYDFDQRVLALGS
jgi:hypothetical protein